MPGNPLSDPLSNHLTIDRIQLAVHDRSEAARAFEQLLDAAIVGEDQVKCLGCRRTTLAVGTSQVELLEASGAGPVQQAGPGLFAAGFASQNVAMLRAHLESQGIAVTSEGEQLFMAPEGLDDHGLRVVVSPEAERTRSGLLTRLYEVTNLVEDPEPWSARFASIFDLDASAFVPIRSDNFGYEGTLTLFRPGHLDQVEIIHPYDSSKTMGRYHAKRGACMYMCYGETDRIDEIRERAITVGAARAERQWTGPQDGPVDNLFLHPRALAGVMLGVSRSSYAWTWSGSPERVEPA